MKIIDYTTPHLVEGGIAIDDRGQLIYINFPMNIKRFYMVSNHKSHFIRAWHAHKKEAKFVTVIQGSAIVGIVKIDDWIKPMTDIEVDRYVLSANKPQLLYIPSGYANGFMNLCKNTKIMFFSTSTLEQSKGDDYRYDPYYWDIWKIKER